MPLFGALFNVLWGNLVALYLALETAKGSLRLTGAVTLAGGYVACVTAWSTFVTPLMATLFSTAYGTLLGLVFPPVAGSTLGGLVMLWGCKLALSYTQRFIVMLFPK